jgi:hypothetical protein
MDKVILVGLVLSFGYLLVRWCYADVSALWGTLLLVGMFISGGWVLLFLFWGALTW